MVTKTYGVKNKFGHDLEIRQLTVVIFSNPIRNKTEKTFYSKPPHRTAQDRRRQDKTEKDRIGQERTGWDKTGLERCG